ncbi:MAG: tetratricopeptide repeat protein [Leptospiraceae bacterium]|nr:tetratricopeptide repeat protein [Leptospiraceae bacterium]
MKTFLQFLTIFLFTITIIKPDELLDSYNLEAKGKYADSLAIMEKLGKSEPSEYLFQLRSGWLSLYTGEYSKSIEYYKKAQVLSPDAIEPKQGMIRAYTGLGNTKQVETVARTILKQDPKNYIGRTNLAYSLYQLGSYKEARKIYESVLSDYPSDLEMILGLGWSYLKEGDKQKSKDAFNRALKISPQNPRAQEGLWYTSK